MCFPAFPIVCDAQEPFADHPVIERKVLLITAVKIVETGLPGIVPAIVQALERIIKGEGTFIQIRYGRLKDDSSDVFRPPGNLFFDARSHVGIVVDGLDFHPIALFQRVGGIGNGRFSRTAVYQEKEKQ